MEKPLNDFSTSIFPVCIPKEANLQLDSWNGKKVTLSGYGSGSEDTESSTIHYVSLTVSSQEECTEKYKDSSELAVQKNIPNGIITDELICATQGFEAQGSCPGDSGGPLVSLENDRIIQLGTVSGSAKECNSREYPSVFGRLDNYHVLNFIKQTAFGETIPKPDELNGMYLLPT